MGKPEAQDSNPVQDNITAAKYAYGKQDSLGAALDEAKGLYQGGMNKLGDYQKNITDFYSTMGNNGEAWTVDPSEMGRSQVNLFGGDPSKGGRGVEGTIRDRLGNVNTDSVESI